MDTGVDNKAILKVLNDQVQSELLLMISSLVLSLLGLGIFGAGGYYTLCYIFSEHFDLSTAIGVVVFVYLAALANGVATGGNSDKDDIEDPREQGCVMWLKQLLGGSMVATIRWASGRGTLSNRELRLAAAIIDMRLNRPEVSAMELEDAIMDTGKFQVQNYNRALRFLLTRRFVIGADMLRVNLDKLESSLLREEE